VRRWASRAGVATAVVLFALLPGLARAAAARPSRLPRSTGGHAATASYVASRFKTKIDGELLPESPNVLRLTRVSVIVPVTLRSDEVFTVSCSHCHARWGTVHYRRHEAYFTPPRPIDVTSRSRLTVTMTGPDIVGRVKVYRLQPRLQSHRLIGSACLLPVSNDVIKCPGPLEEGIPYGPDAVTGERPRCPQACQVMAQTTGFGVATDHMPKIATIPIAGEVTKWSLRLAQPTTSQTAGLNGTEGGESEAGIAVLRNHLGAHQYELVAVSEPIKLEPFFGKTATFTLTPPVTIQPGDVIALVVPTWAPAFATGLGSGTTWRSSRSAQECASPQMQSVQSGLSSIVDYECVYSTSTPLYGFTVVPTG
jgi:hypothetical protein